MFRLHRETNRDLSDEESLTVKRVTHLYNAINTDAMWTEVWDGRGIVKCKLSMLRDGKYNTANFDDTCYILQFQKTPFVDFSSDKQELPNMTRTHNKEKFFRNPCV